ncbi:hypothetical protein C2G38_1769945 [Gigaspora rosea]|uniref:Uncharacterized protein n=1 Tax=Gigaspora rosea TaxID=44941 RepID=A0A397VY95_9GLOM|nr:hypothetical protein C2G38_1769945 [Gigaspora rosea]
MTTYRHGHNLFYPNWPFYLFVLSNKHSKLLLWALLGLSFPRVQFVRFFFPSVPWSWGHVDHGTSRSAANNSPRLNFSRPVKNDTGFYQGVNFVCLPPGSYTRVSLDFSKCRAASTDDGPYSISIPGPFSSFHILFNNSIRDSTRGSVIFRGSWWLFRDFHTLGYSIYQGRIVLLNYHL